MRSEIELLHPGRQLEHLESFVDFLVEWIFVHPDRPCCSPFPPIKETNLPILKAPCRVWENVRTFLQGLPKLHEVFLGHNKLFDSRLVAVQELLWTLQGLVEDFYSPVSSRSAFAAGIVDVGVEDPQQKSCMFSIRLSRIIGMNNNFASNGAFDQVQQLSSEENCRMILFWRLSRFRNDGQSRLVESVALIHLSTRAEPGLAVTTLKCNDAGSCRVLDFLGF